MEKEYWVTEKRKTQQRGEFEVKRRAKKVKCWDCGVEWLIRKDRKTPQYCRVCRVKEERNPMHKKTPWNKGESSDYEEKEYKRNYYNQQRWDKKKKLIQHMGNKCWRCGMKNLPICVWQWHHFDPKNKQIALSQVITHSWTKILEEAKKCVLVCSNCHKIIHYGEERLDAI